MNKKEIYGNFLKVIEKLFGIDNAKILDTLIRFRIKLNLKNPKTLSDKVSYIELHTQSPLASVCTDKFEVRNYIKKKNLSAILIPVYGGAYRKLEDVDFDSLPKSFVIKATHGCKMNYVVKDKDTLNLEKCKREISRWLSTTYGTYSMEPHYTKIPHRVYVEKYLDSMDQLIDYKFHCLNGEPKFVLTCSNRKIDGDKAMTVTLDLFDMNWNNIQGIKNVGLEQAGDGNISKPKCFNKMVEVSKELSKDFTFVRVDLYEINNRVYFGELTFSPACCVFPYFSKEFDKTMGDSLAI